MTNRDRVIDIGQTVASDLFTAGQNPLGQTIQLGSASFKIIGVLASKGSTGFLDQDAVVIAPYTAVEDLLTGYSQSFSQLIVQGRSASTLNLAQSEVESVLASANDTTVANLPVPRAQPADAADRRHEHLEDLHRAARGRGGDLAARRRHRRHEHHARDRHRAHARDRHPQGDRRAEERDPERSSCSRPSCCR